MRYFERLNALDASVLELEYENSPMHLGFVLLLESGPLARPDSAVDMARIRRHVEMRLHRAPRLREKLGYIPIEGSPIWVDDDHFDLDYHLRHTRLPAPGSERQLRRLCGRLLGQRIDPARPLWELWVIEGLCEGRFALLLKVHHAVAGADGVAGLLATLLAVDPDPACEAPPRWLPRGGPRFMDLIGSEIARRSRGAFDLAGSLVGAAADPGTAIESAVTLAGEWLGYLGTAMRPASGTPLNEPIGPHRRIDWLRLDAESIDAVGRRARGATANQVLASILAGALGRLLRGRRIDPSAIDFRALLLADGCWAQEGGSKVRPGYGRLAPLPIAERDPVARLAEIVGSDAGESSDSSGLEALAALGDLLGFGLFGLAARQLSSRLPFNVLVGETRGAEGPMELCGAPVVESYPLLPLLGEQALSVGICRHEGALYLGFNTDWEAVPELHDFVAGVAVEFEELAGRNGTGASAAIRAVSPHRARARRSAPRRHAVSA
jgi:diacylglycerol O-acyltransferase